MSPGHRSLTGFPEGCALSVFSMALVDMMLDAWLGAQGSLVHSLHTYVDDWHVLASSPSALEHIWDSVMGFSKNLDLDVDEKKSFVWATHSQDRKALQGGSLKVHLASKALGAHHNFSRKKGNKAIVDRVAQMQSLWSKLRSSASPYAVKVKALLQVAWPRAFYGISVVFLGKAHFQKLRTGALRGLKADRVGANPVAHLASNSIWSDPEAWSILQTFRETREVGGPRCYDNYAAGLLAHNVMWPLPMGQLQFLQLVVLGLDGSYVLMDASLIGLASSQCFRFIGMLSLPG